MWFSFSSIRLQKGRCDSLFVSSDTQNSHLLCHAFVALLFIRSLSVMYLPVSQLNL